MIGPAVAVVSHPGVIATAILGGVAVPPPAAAPARKRPGPPPGYGAKPVATADREHLLALDAAGLSRGLAEALTGIAEQRIRRELGAVGEGARPKVGYAANLWHWPEGTRVRQRESGVEGVVSGVFAGPSGRSLLLLRTDRGLLVEYAEPGLIEIVRRRPL